MSVVSGDPADLQAILDDPRAYYVNLHTTTPVDPGGAVREQLHNPKKEELQSGGRRPPGPPPRRGALSRTRAGRIALAELVDIGSEARSAIASSRISSTFSALILALAREVEAADVGRSCPVRRRASRA